MYKFEGPLVAARGLVIAGTTVAAGASLSKAQVANMRTLNAWVAKGWVKPKADPYGRRTELGTPSPSYANPSVVKSLV